MNQNLILDLDDCTEFRQTLQARPPRIVHGTVMLLVALLGTVLAWLAFTEAHLIVRASGRVRPLATPMKVFCAANSEALSATTGGRVILVNFGEGDVVRRGDVLLRLDTERLDIDIAKRQRTIQAGEEELAKLDHLKDLGLRQSEGARAKAEADLAQAVEEVRKAKERQAAEVCLAEVELKKAEHEAAQLRKLVSYRAAAPDDLVKAAALARQAKQQLTKARVPVNEGKVEVLRRALELVARDYAVKRDELEMKRDSKQHEIEVARLELANLKLQRKQAEICAPMAGTVTKGDVKVGDILERGKPVLEIAAQNGFLFEATVPSEEVGHLQVGLTARIKLDAYDYQRYGTLSGTVCYLSPDSGVAEGRSTVTYIVKIALEGDEIGRGEFHGKVKLGMAGHADIVTDQESLLSLLVKRIRQTISLD
jgi:multidrug resistance efflux pump